MLELALPGLYVFSKQQNFKFIHCSENFATLAGFDSAQKIIGKKDSDAIWRTQAALYNKVDQQVIDGKLLYFNQVETLPLENRMAEILISKYPLIDKEERCVGVSCYFIEITGHTLIPKKGYLDHKTKRFYFEGPTSNCYFTSREIEVLKLLMIGYQPKKMAAILKISKRTVDEYIENIKNKLNCHTQTEIICVAIKMGLSHLTAGL